MYIPQVDSRRDSTLESVMEQSSVSLSIITLSEYKREDRCTKGLDTNSVTHQQRHSELIHGNVSCRSLNTFIFQKYLIDKVKDN